MSYLLLTHIREHRLGEILEAPCDLHLGAQVVQPDLIFIAVERRHIIQPDEITGAPDLVIEILSESTAGRDRTYKRTLYARHGVSEYWLVDPDAQTVEVLMLTESGFIEAGKLGVGQRVRSPLMPGFGPLVDELFAEM